MTNLETPSNDFEVSVLIPAKNEAENIPSLVTEIHQSLHQHVTFEVVLVNDGSTDETARVFTETCESLNVPAQLISTEQSVGQSTALYIAGHNARAKWLVTIDGDGQNDPADIPNMVSEANSLQGSSDFCIAGYRHKRKDTPWKRFQSRIANRVRNWFLNDGVPDTGCGLKLIPKSTWVKLPYFNHMHRYLPALIKRIGGDIRVVPVAHRDRTAGVSKYTAWNRVWVGIVDMFAVKWLIARTKHPVIKQHTHINTEQKNNAA
ncbi:glycosyltransferase family 2 protein [Pseudoalteromonas xiamenensis]